MKLTTQSAEIWRMKVRASAFALFVSVVPASSASDELERYISACEAAIQARQISPKLYQRISATPELRVWPKSEAIAFLEGWRTDKAEAQMKKFEDGRWAPRDITVIFEYEATNNQSEVVKKRSLCETTAAHSEAEVTPDDVIVDGKVSALGTH